MKTSFALAIILAAFALTSNVQAVESGSTRNGEVHCVYKDGKKIGNTAEERDRKVASFEKAANYDYLAAGIEAVADPSKE